MTGHDEPAGGTGDGSGGTALPAYVGLLDVLRCPHCRGPFVTPTGTEPHELVCSSCGRAYPVRGGVTVLLVDEARLPDDGSDEGPDEVPGGARG